jgi:predicted NBD/HSP70 family sugar kinase
MILFLLPLGREYGAGIFLNGRIYRGSQYLKHPGIHLRQLQPNFSPNLQSGKLEVNSVKMKKARIRVFHDAKHLAELLLPIIPIVR